MGVVEAEGLSWRVTVGGFLGAGKDVSIWVGTGLLGKAEDEAMHVDICKPDVPHSLSCNALVEGTCRDASSSTSVKKSLKIKIHVQPIYKQCHASLPS